MLSISSRSQTTPALAPSDAPAAPALALDTLWACPWMLGLWPSLLLGLWPSLLLSLWPKLLEPEWLHIQTTQSKRIFPIFFAVRARIFVLGKIFLMGLLTNVVQGFAGKDFVLGPLRNVLHGLAG